MARPSSTRGRRHDRRPLLPRSVRHSLCAAAAYLEVISTITSIGDSVDEKELSPEAQEVIRLEFAIACEYYGNRNYARMDSLQVKLNIAEQALRDKLPAITAEV